MTRRPVASSASAGSVALLYQQHAPPLFDYLRRHLASLEDAEDTLVDVFVAALEREYVSRLSEQEQQAWLWQVARHKVVDAYRRGKRHPIVPLSTVAEDLQGEDDATPEEASERREEEDALRALIQGLSPLQQHLLHLRFAADLRCVQIASLLGQREGTVRSTLARTLNRLRGLYEQQSERRSRDDPPG
jgi:RNA polymerase sigma-70 factor (ECF subfamily)